MIRPLSCLMVPALLTAAPTPKVLSPAGTVEKQIETFNAHDLEAVTIYQVKAGKIVRMWSLQE